MISWVLVAAEIAVMFALFWLLDGKPCQRRVLIWFFLLSVVVGCLALFLDGTSDLMRVLCLSVSLRSYMKVDDLRRKSKAKNKK